MMSKHIVVTDTKLIILDNTISGPGNPVLCWYSFDNS